MSPSPTQELVMKVLNHDLLETWELEHLYSKLNEDDKRLVGLIVVRLLDDIHNPPQESIVRVVGFKEIKD